MSSCLSCVWSSGGDSLRKDEAGPSLKKPHKLMRCPGFHSCTQTTRSLSCILLTPWLLLSPCLEAVPTARASPGVVGVDNRWLCKPLHASTRISCTGQATGQLCWVCQIKPHQIKGFTAQGATQNQIKIQSLFSPNCFWGVRIISM